MPKHAVIDDAGVLLKNQFSRLRLVDLDSYIFAKVTSAREPAVPSTHVKHRAESRSLRPDQIPNQRDNPFWRSDLRLCKLLRCLWMRHFQTRVLPTSFRRKWLAYNSFGLA